MTGGLMKTTVSRLALAAIASVVATGAMAADLGGNCCADLEERISELEATTARKGNRKVSLTVSGHVNKAIVWHDSDSSTAHRDGTFSIQDNEALQTRFRFIGSAKLDADRTAGYTLELGIGENDGVNFGNSTAGNNSRVRQSFVYIQSATLGRLALGQGSQATDGIIDINLAGTGLVNLAQAPNYVRLMGFQTASFVDLNGGRIQAIRYDSPTFAGFTLSAAWGHAAPTVSNASDLDDDSTQWDVALRYAGEFNGVRLAAGIGYREVDLTNSSVALGGPLSDATDKIWLGSGSILHVPTGLFVSGGFGDRDRSAAVAGADVTQWWGQVGIQRNWFGIGPTTLYGEYGIADFDTEGTGPTGVGATTIAFTDGRYWGLGFVQNLSAAAADVYLNYRNLEADGLTSGVLTQSDDISVFSAGMIVRF